MELDFQTIKALSSSTRIKLLHRILLQHEMEKNVTPTMLSKDMGKAKSTISSHLDVLQEAGLVARDEQQGRRRVTYAPTPKAKTIISGSERKVRFSLTSGAVSAVAGAGLLVQRVLQDTTTLGTQAAMTTAEAAPPADGGGIGAAGLMTPELALMLGGGALLAMATISLLYAAMIWRLTAR